MLHEYGADAWGPWILDQIADNGPPVSFRELWHTIAASVREHVTRGEGGAK